MIISHVFKLSYEEKWRIFVNLWHTYQLPYCVNNKKFNLFVVTKFIDHVLRYLILAYCLINISRLTLVYMPSDNKNSSLKRRWRKTIKILEFSASFHLHRLHGLHYAAVLQTLKLEKKTRAVLFQWFQFLVCSVLHLIINTSQFSTRHVTYT